jgi:large conductance mechanosensitive channel
MSIYKEFKEFAIKGDVLDLAVAIVIGNAFGKIVSSLVQDILMPLVGKLMGNINLVDLRFQVAEAQVENGVEVVPAAYVNLGLFLSTVVDFIFVAIAIFVVIKLINKIRPQREDPKI